MLRISVIIPTFNRASLLPRAIDSVLAQSYPVHEIIIVDDGSKDETKQLLKQYYPQTHIIQQNNRGVSAARNKGIQAATGEWIALLDSDDSWETDKLEKQAGALAHLPQLLICHTNETWYRNGVVLQQRNKHRKKGGYIYQHCLPLCVISPSSVVIHKIVFADIGLFDDSLPVCEDYDMWLRICSQYPTLFIDEPLTNKFGGHSDQLSRQHWGMDRFRVLALKKSIEQGRLSPSDREAAIEMMLKKINIFLKGAKKHQENEYSQILQAILIQYTPTS